MDSMKTLAVTKLNAAAQVVQLHLKQQCLSAKGT